MTDRTPPQEREREAVCVSCSQPAHKFNSLDDPPVLHVRPKWAICFGCIPGDAALNDEMEPEEVAIVCWHSMLTSGNRPSEEVAELLMSWTALRERAVAARVRAELRETVSGMRGSISVFNTKHDGTFHTFERSPGGSYVEFDAVAAALTEETTG